jgi:predicted ATPase
MFNGTKTAIKYAFSGTHGTGKTTKVANLFNDLKMKHSDKNIGLLLENAEFSPLPINKDTSNLSQSWIFTHQMCEEIRLGNHYDMLITDRTIIDAIAYTKVAGIEAWKGMYEFSKYFIESYDTIFFVDYKKNHYVFDDGIRDGQDLKFREEVGLVLYDLYMDLIKDNYNIKLEVI